MRREVGEEDAAVERVVLDHRRREQPERVAHPADGEDQAAHDTRELQDQRGFLVGRAHAAAVAVLAELLLHVAHHVDERLGRVEAALDHDERRLPLQALLRRVGEPDVLALVEATTDHEAVHRGVLLEDLRDRPHEHVLDR